MVDICCEISWLISLLTTLSQPVHLLMPLHCDNRYAIYIATNPIFHERTKHIKINCHYVREKLQTDIISPMHLPTTEQPADMFKILSLLSSLQIYTYNQLTAKVS